MSTLFAPDSRIARRWEELGGARSPLGNPTGPEVKTAGGAWQPFERGVMIWSVKTDAHPNYGKIRDAYADHGFEQGHLGYPTSDELAAKDGGRFQRFEHGTIYWYPKTGAYAVYGAIYDRWAQLGWERGSLGFPVGDEFGGSKPGGRVQRFQGGVLYWTVDGAYPVWGLMLEQYGRDGWEGGRWGYPTGDEVRRDGGWLQRFQGGDMTVKAPVPQRSIPEVHEGDPKVWIRMAGGEGWGCVCMATTLPLIEADMKRRGLIRDHLDIFQMGYNAGGVAASAGTHDAGGVIDVAQYSRDQRQCWADFGVAMFPRTANFGWRGGEHGHGVWHGCVHRTASAAQQVRDGLAGYDGLVAHNRYNFVMPTRTWQEALR